MKKSQLRQLVKEAMGYSKYAPGGTTKGGTTDDFRNILTTIAKGRPEEEEKYQGDPQRGNGILDRGNPNIPLDEGEGEQTYNVTFYVGDDDYDWDVKASSPEEAIKKVKSGEAEGPYGQTLPRTARKFNAVDKK